MDNLRFVEFRPEDAPRLAAFNAEIRTGLDDLGSFDSHDESYYFRYTGREGWTVGFEDKGQIVSTYTAIRDLAPFRKSWLFPTEAKILKPTVCWGANQAVAAKYRGTDLRMRQRRLLGEFLKSKGINGLLAAVLPSNAGYMFEKYELGQSRIVGIYYDDAGWNHLGARDGTWIEAAMPAEAAAWCSSTDEHAMTELIRAGMISTAAKKVDNDYEIGFGPISE